MNNIKCILLCARVNFRKWRANPRVCVLFLITVIFHYYTFSCGPAVCRYLNMEIAPWVFPFFLGHPSMSLFYGGAAILLYSDAPFADSHTPFLLARAGGRNWILGQLVYLTASSLLYTLFHVAASVAMLIPYVSFSADWGQVLRIMANNEDIFLRAGVTGAGFWPSPELLDAMSPLQAMGWSILLFWLCCLFLGTVVFCFNLCVGGMSGVAAGAFLTVFAYFAIYVGPLSFGNAIRFVSPVYWSCLGHTDWLGTGFAPTPGGAVAAYLAMAALLSLVSVIVFCKRDFTAQPGR